MKFENNTLVFDIGKTHVKSILFSFNGKIIKEYSQNHNFIKKNNNINILEVDKIFEFVLKFIKLMSKNFIVNKIIFTTHACISLIYLNEKNNIFLPVIDYENSFDERFEKNYLKSQKCKFDETLTPNLSKGLVLSKLIYYYIYKMKNKFKLVQSIIFYPQYFAWRLSGVKSSEITYLGCHSDLWSFKKKNFSNFVFKNNLQKKIPTIHKSWDRLGKIKKEIIVKTNVYKNCKIYCGAHDSSASYYLYEKKFNEPFTLISTGTWIVIFNKKMNLNLLSEDNEIFAKLNIYGKKIPVIRFMGGREYLKILNKKTSVNKSKKNINYFFKKKIFVVPAFAEGGPFKKNKGRIINHGLIDSLLEYNNLASLYIALITDYCLNKIDSKNSIIIDGGFTKNKFFLNYLSALRINQKIFINKDINGTATGAFLLCNKKSNYKLNLKKISKSSNNVLEKYKKEWLSLLK